MEIINYILITSLHFIQYYIQNTKNQKKKIISKIKIFPQDLITDTTKLNQILYLFHSTNQIINLIPFTGMMVQEILKVFIDITIIYLITRIKLILQNMFIHIKIRFYLGFLIQVLILVKILNMNFNGIIQIMVQQLV